MPDTGGKLADAMARATRAWEDRWERERSTQPEPLYDFTYHVEFGGGRKLGMKLRADQETGMWVKAYLESWPAEDRTFGFVPVKGGGDGQRDA